MENNKTTLSEEQTQAVSGGISLEGANCCWADAKILSDAERRAPMEVGSVNLDSPKFIDPESCTGENTKNGFWGWLKKLFGNF